VDEGCVEPISSLEELGVKDSHTVYAVTFKKAVNEFFLEQCISQKTGPMFHWVFLITTTMITQ